MPLRSRPAPFAESLAVWRFDFGAAALDLSQTKRPIAIPLRGLVPIDPEDAVAAQQGAVFGCIGRKFVKRHAESGGGVGIKPDRRPGYLDPPTVR